MALKVPWSKQHKTITGGLPLSFSNSHTELLSMPELVELTRARGDHALVDAFDQHGLEYTANGGSLDLRQTIASLYGDAIGADNILVFCGGQVALQICAFALLTRADHVIVFTPGY
jgi:aspartate/methionine/tyrosine aminotransferase